MAAIGTSPTYYDFDQLEEIQMSTGGNDIFKHTGGVSVNLVTKRGTNEFRGSVRFLLTDGQGYFGGLLRQADRCSVIGRSLLPPRRMARVEVKTPFQTVRADFPHTAYGWPLGSWHYAASG